ncbi:hypothetical protein L1D14_18545 [Vibrio tubiashii]|uniref:hypothetical protein n=1 Tax=Vibrio tubiashii TaxID=29498 RepID=UPI001EFCD0BB|nr:hypothetical protein [Vibrio tubiashii]MCG9578216.1 hypothetical protein [Vibrio tubiashii]
MEINCDWQEFGLCWVKAGASTDTIFGFSEFISAFALLVIVYTITDFKYKFRITIAPINLKVLTFFLIIIIGFGTLISQLWVAQSWPTPSFNLSQALWQSILALLFMMVLCLWIWFAFIYPPRFNRYNYKSYYQEMYRIIINGDENEINILSEELCLSISEIVNSSINTKNNQLMKDSNSILLLMGDRRFCNSLAKNNPMTIITIFESLASLSSVPSNMGVVAANISTALIANKDSQLYHEDNWISSGLLGHLKPLGQRIYGDYRMVEHLGNHNVSPFDINLNASIDWDEQQLRVYCQSISLCLKSYVENKRDPNLCSTLFRAIHQVQSLIPNTSELNDCQGNFYSTPASRRFRVILNFGKTMADILQESSINKENLKLRSQQQPNDIYDLVVEFYIDCIHSSACIKTDHLALWVVQHNMVWNTLFFTEPKYSVRKIILHRLRRELFKEFELLTSLPNHKSARLLGYCLNVIWLNSSKKASSTNEHLLRKILVRWINKNFISLYNNYPNIAQSCLIGGISYNSDECSFKKLYRPLLDGSESSKTYKLNCNQ